MLKKKVFVNQAYYKAGKVSIKLHGSYGSHINELDDYYHLPENYRLIDDGSEQGQWASIPQDLMSASNLRALASQHGGYVTFKKEPVGIYTNDLVGVES